MIRDRKANHVWIYHQIVRDMRSKFGYITLSAIDFGTYLSIYLKNLIL